jgi:hypothetical protein
MRCTGRSTTRTSRIGTPKAALDHAEPRELVTAVRTHEGAVMRLLGEIEALVAEVAP